MDKIICKTEVAVLLATYNGEKYLAQQLDSLLGQTFRNITVFVHDDGSTDETLDIVKSYERRFDNVKLLGYNSPSGPRDNFLCMLGRIDAPYYFFSDQDDVWMPEKIAQTLSAIKDVEKEFSMSMPVVASCDLYITDEELNITEPSFWRVAGIYPRFLTTFEDAAAANATTGCAMAFNNAAARTVKPHGGRATMHDTWVTLCTLKAGGVLKSIETPLIYYRQHASNILGSATPVDTLTLQYKLQHIKKIYRMLKRHYLMLRQLEYGSLLKFIRCKMRYKRRISKLNYNKK